MRVRNIMAVVALASMTAFAACGSDEAGKNGKSPIEDGVEGTAAAWILKATSTCASAEEGCAGQYGFSLHSDGRYELGPSPEGKIRKGQVSAEELIAIADLLEGAKKTAKAKTLLGALKDETCVDAAVERDLKVVLTQKGKDGEVFTASNAKLCHAASFKQNGVKLHDTVQALSKKYYVLPFPDSCLDAAAEIELQYADLQGCSTDTDCAYVDNVYGAIPSDHIAFVMTDDCSILKPLVVANAAKIGAAQDVLLTAREDLRTSCGERVERASCEFVAGFEAQLGAPTCSAGKCVVNQAVYQQ